MAKPIRYLRLTIRQIEDVTSSIRRIVLEDADGWDLPPFLPGAHVDLNLTDKLTRTYSLCNAPKDGKRYILTVKREDDGRGGSRFIHQQLHTQDVVDVSLPRGGLDWNGDARIVMIAGGIGITPFISLATHFEQTGQDYILYWMNRGAPPLLDMLEAPLAAGRVILRDTLREARLDPAVLVNRHGDSARYACCGGTSLMQAFETAVAHLPPGQSHIEQFTPPAQPAVHNGKPYRLVLAKSKRDILVPPGQRMMDALQSANADVSFSCEGGICGSCRVRWLEGEPIHHDSVLGPAQRHEFLMPCVAGCASDKLVLDI